MRKLIKIVFGFVVIAIGALVVVPFLIPMDTYKNEAVARASAMLGREVKIDGAMRLKLFPNVAVSLKKVTIGNPKGFSTTPFATVESFDVEVPLSALMDKKIIIQSLELDGAQIALEVNSAGANNWQFEFKKPQALLPDFSIISSAHAAEKQFSLKGLALNHIAIKNSTLNFKNAQNKTSQSLKDISLTAKADSISKPLNINGSVKWNGEALKLDAVAESIEALMSGKPVTLKAAVDAAPAKISFDGKAGSNYAKGAFEFGSPSLTKTMSWLGNSFAWNKTALKTAVRGTLEYNGSQVNLSKAELAVDDLRFAGNIGAVLGKKPKITGNLSTANLNLNPYADNARTFSIISEAYAAAPWQTTPINLQGLQAVDADISLKADKMVFSNWDISGLVTHLTLQGGALALDIAKLEAFGGTLKGLLSARSSGSVGIKINGEGVQVEPLLKQLAKNDGIRGTASFNANLTAQGNSQAQMISTLSGTSNVVIRNGAIKGINLAQMARNIRGAFTGGGGAERDTDFAELGGNFNVANGVISNKDLAMKAPYLRLKGEGQINLPAYFINYRLVPELVDTGKGQGGAEKQGLAVPVLVSGPLDNPNFAPDLAGMATDALKDPAKFKENIAAAKDIIKDNKVQLKELKQQLKDPEKLLQNPDLGNVLGGFGFKSKPKTAPAPAVEPTPTPATSSSSAPAEAPAPAEAAPVQ